MTPKSEKWFSLSCHTGYIDIKINGTNFQDKGALPQLANGYTYYSKTQENNRGHSHTSTTDTCKRQTVHEKHCDGKTQSLQSPTCSLPANVQSPSTDKGISANSYL
jgi:hypothetical protein